MSLSFIQREQRSNTGVVRTPENGYWVSCATSSFSNLSITSPTSQLILQPFRRFTYITAQSPTLLLLHLHHSSFSNPSFVSSLSQALHLIHLASRTCPLNLYSCSFAIYLMIKLAVFAIITGFSQWYPLFTGLSINSKWLKAQFLIMYIHCTKSIQYMYVCSNAIPLHYYVLRVLHKADRWHWVWSIFSSRTAWADHITCGTSICIVYWRKLRLGWLYV